MSNQANNGLYGMSAKLQTIPDKVAARQQDFALNGDKVLLRDPSLKTNQERAASVILE